ncbi:MAG: cytochrome c1 [Hyphomicrobiales bacterium]|nr:cytochrome c1 [Hyphomicrobiales bacterium]
MAPYKNSLAAVVIIASVITTSPISSVYAADEGTDVAYNVAKQDWTFGSMTGYFDRAQLQRGYKVYKEVCSACHGMKFMYFRNLSQPGGPEFSAEQTEAIAASVEVEDGPNEEGAMFMRPAKPSDKFPLRFKNDKEAAAANNGAVPPDLSLMAKARTVETHSAWYMFPVNMVTDLATQYQEAGPDYIHALLTGYDDIPSYQRDGSGRLTQVKAGETVPNAEQCVAVQRGEGSDPDVCTPLGDGLNYNRVYPGHQIAMVNPLSDGVVDYEDGTPATLDNYSKDVTAYLMWSSERKLEERKKLGLKVLLYLIILTGLLYLSKRALWRDVEH